ncbi:amidohydrolase [Leucobacter triazinivorans]|uniref:Amidohydrolase n=1 Tax=Leucobacter triazinivorans TaxID=1784719 RepID=A0A4P6KHJ0_9MICO|nr:amidohydrolase [Leucobacter triazinivorans]QBE49770.1 amidohydrolase [Leucobacter triazinivorans]
MHIAADLCIVSGRVFDGRARTRSTAVAVAHGRIVAVGTDDAVLALRGTATRVVDARGGAILPGFVDAHAHAVFAGVERLSLDLTPARSVEDTLARIRRAAAALDAAGDPEAWLTGGGWSHDLLEHPTRQMLDTIAPHRPVALSDAGHHTLWVNSRALELAGIDRDTPQPANGHVHLDADGEPTGYLNEGGVELIAPVIPAASLAEMTAGLLEAQRTLWELGVTGWHEAILGDFNGKADCTPAYLAAIADDSLRSRVSGALWIPPGTTLADVPALVEEFERRRARNEAAGFASSTCKAMVDGVPQGETAALLDPYCSHPHSGELHIDAETMRELAVQLDARGFALHLHIMGDRGTRVALDAVEAARRANGPGPRHHFAHLSMVDVADAARFGPLGVTANIQGLWATRDPSMIAVVGEERAERAYPFRDIAASGADLAMGSDWPVSLADPWQAIHVAVNRAHPFGPAAGAPPLSPAQALTLPEALAAYTSGSATLVLGAAGRVRVGERADLVVSTEDPFGLPSDELFRVGTAATIVAGEVVFERVEAHTPASVR